MDNRRAINPVVSMVMMLNFIRLALRPAERFLTQCILVSTEPSAFVQERIRLGDTTISDKLPPILLSRQSAAHRRKLFLGEGHSAATALTRNLDEQPIIRAAQFRSPLGLNLDEAGFGAGGNLAGGTQITLLQ